MVCHRRKCRDLEEIGEYFQLAGTMDRLGHYCSSTPSQIHGETTVMERGRSIPMYTQTRSLFRPNLGYMAIEVAKPESKRGGAVEVTAVSMYVQFEFCYRSKSL